VPDPAPTLTLLHNPNCSTSVHALDALEHAGHAVTVRRYLLVAERLSEPELRSLAERLQGDPPDALIRRDKRYAELGLDADGLGLDEVVAILVEHPALLQRPILDDGTVAMIGRPRSRAAAWASTGRVVDAFTGGGRTSMICDMSTGCSEQNRRYSPGTVSAREYFRPRRR
jgi:arsenate reductase